MKAIVIENNSSLTYNQIGYILDNQKNIAKHLNENIYYETDMGMQFVFNVSVESTDEYDKWIFRNAGC